MTRVVPTNIWEEPDARRSTSRLQIVYPVYDGAGAWHLGLVAADQDGTFVLRDSRLFLNPTVVAGGRMGIFGDRRTVGFLNLPTDEVVDFYTPGLSVTGTRSGSAAILTRG
ncbi:MAG: hypothetical protein AMXMBFR53_36400 [Gemmatimonadota bacterium]